MSDHAMHYPVLVRSLFTEKVSRMQNANNTWGFQVKRDANKVQIRQAIEAIFGVKVLSVRTQRMSGKIKRVGFGHGRTADWKKAYVQLAEGQS
ncbi:MAG TPA: 50S ribosomal protein L23, partial [Planctomycetota bacterium]|nr:50S ribosomal protein L23 [Planctomycetota bacterium]